MIFNAFFAATVFTTVATILCYASTAIAAGEVYLLVQCWSDLGCTGNRRDATSKSIQNIELTECNSAYTPLAKGRLCSKSKCGGTCTNSNSSTTCYNAPGGFGNPYVSYCPGS